MLNSINITPFIDFDFSNKNIVLYCAGNYGQQLYKRLENSEFCKIVKWVDEDYWLYRRMGLNVDSPEELNSSEPFDCIVVASIDTEQSLGFRAKLEEKGINPNKIAIVDERKIDALYSDVLSLLFKE